MIITRETVEHVAKLARLDLSPGEVERYTQDLSRILALADELNQLDLSQIQTDIDLGQPTVLRADEPVREFTREALLKNAPDEEDGYFRVPKILAEE